MSEPGIELRLALRHASFTLDADLRLPSRGVTALFGPSGAGKTSCLRVLAGLDRYSGSYVAIDGEAWQDDARGLFVPAHRRRVGYVPQEAGLFPHLAVRANLEYGWRRAGRPSGVEWSEIVDLLDLGALLERKPARLSGGERQRAAIARALLTDPRLLLLDEPLSALDAARKSEVLPYLQRLHERLSMPAIYVSHALDEVARLADHIVVLEGGRVVSAGPLSEVLAGIDVETSFAHDSSVVLETVVAEHDAGDRLSRLTFAGGSLFVSLRPEPPGSRLRCRINARDVSIATEPPAYLSTLNVIPATVIAGQPTHDQSQVLVRLDAGGAALVALITRRSWVRLALGPGAKVWAVVKSAALVS